MSDEFRVNSTWLPMKGRLLVLPDNIDAVAIRVLCGTDFPLPVAPSNLAVHPEEFFDEDEQYDYELIWSCPANLPDFWEDERLRWATNICQRARTDKLRDMDPALLVRKLLYEG